MANYETKAEITDRMSAEQLKQREKVERIDFFRGNKENLFFVCGTVQGYVHKKLQEALENHTANLYEVQYAVIRKEGEKEGVPCLFLGAKLVDSL